MTARGDFEQLADGRFCVDAAALVRGQREVSVELIVNGRPAATKTLKADGAISKLVFEAPELPRSSWVAVRIHPHAHSNPIAVLIGGKPIRASRNSARWCLAGVDQCWKEKSQFYAPEELEQARADYEHARQAYRRIIEESEVD